ncbi:hypothetical protein Tco_0449737 [Tanacetum coccineum]
MMDLAVQFDNASAAKQDLRQAYEKCNDIPQDTRNLIDTFLKRESDKDYEMNLAMYRKTVKIEKQIETKYAWLSENTNSFHSPTINTNYFHNFFSHIQTIFQKLTMSETNQSNPLAPEKPTKAILQQPYITPNHDSETHKGGSSSEQNTHKPTSPITHEFLTEKEYQQLLQDEEVLRQTLEEQARDEKEWEDRIKKKEAERATSVKSGKLSQLYIFSSLGAETNRSLLKIFPSYLLDPHMTQGGPTAQPYQVFRLLRNTQMMHSIPTQSSSNFPDLSKGLAHLRPSPAEKGLS